MLRKRLFITILFSVVAYGAVAQSFFAMRRSRKLILSGGIGTATYFGDLRTTKSYMDATPSVNIGLQLYVTHRIAVRGELGWFQISASDAESGKEDYMIRNLSFKSNNFELNTVGIYNLYRNGRRFYQRPSFNVYAFAGIGLLYSNPKALYNGDWVALQPLQTEGKSYSLFQPVIPFGFGIKFKQGPFWNICLEGGYRKTFTDYLDDVSSKRYPDPATLSSDLSRALSDRRGEYFASIGETFTPKPNVGKRGNPANDDGYFIFNIKVEYYLPYQFASNSQQQKTFKKKKKAFYRYNKRGGLKK